MPPIPISTPERSDRIVNALGLVRLIAGRLHHQFPASSLDDLIQIGALGLIGAIDDDDGRGDVRRSAAYVKCRIRGAMLNALGTRDRGLAIVGAEQSTPDASAARYELQEALESLAEMEREILLRRLEGYTRAEIALHIQLAPREVRRYEERAITQLRRREVKRKAA